MREPVTVISSSARRCASTARSRMQHPARIACSSACSGTSVAKHSRSSATSARRSLVEIRARASTSVSSLVGVDGLGGAAALLGREDVEPARDELHLGLLEHRARRVRQRRPAGEAHRVAALVQVRDVVGAPREAVREIADLDRARARLAGRELDGQARLREQLVGQPRELEPLRQPRAVQRLVAVGGLQHDAFADGEDRRGRPRDAARRGIRARDRHGLADRALEQRPRRQPVEVEVAFGERPRGVRRRSPTAATASRRRPR